MIVEFIIYTYLKRKINCNHLFYFLFESVSNYDQIKNYSKISFIKTHFTSIFITFKLLKIQLDKLYVQLK